MTIAETRSGKVEGFEKDGVHVFRGIPYAAPPVGALRWQPPQREAAWDDVRDATKFSAQSAQTPFPMMTLTGAQMPADSEDSLYLNIYTPGCDDKARPVLFWIHGGAFIWGSGDTSWYDGTPFANHGDVVVVTINYRLGPFGFLHLDDLFEGFAGSGNCGILDQIAALEWVRDNIAAFGGNPDDVLIFGESAGGASVGTLLGTPAAKGLFHKAVPQSGAASWIATPEGATDATSQLLANLGVEPGDRDALLAKTTQEIKDAMPPFVENGGNLLPYQPVIDGVVLPEPPLDAIRNGNAKDVHVLIGTNHDEMTLFVAADPEFASLTDDIIATRATTAGFDGPGLVAHFRAQRPDATPAELWLQLATEAVFRFPAIALAEAQLAHGPVWMYLFTWGTPVFGGFLKSTHALEIPFVFDQLGTVEAKFFTGEGAERQGIADAMHGAWIALARTGSPAHGGLPDWPAYDLTRRATMRFDVECELLDDPEGALRDAFAARSGGAVTP
jgi:para-nitrobenzyl esterase